MNIVPSASRLSPSCDQKFPKLLHETKGAGLSRSESLIWRLLSLLFRFLPFLFDVCDVFDVHDVFDFFL